MQKSIDRQQQAEGVEVGRGSSGSLSHNQLLRVPSHGDLLLPGYEFLNQSDLSDLGAYELQVGGHAEFVKPASDSRIVLKPYDSYEFAFYSRLLSDKAARLLPFTARCFGAVLATNAADSQSPLAPKFVMLEDLAHGLQRPAIADLKMGLRQRSLRNASPEKTSRARMKAAQTTSHVCGFRLCGLAFWESPERRNFQDKYAGRALDEVGVFDTFKRFFLSNENLIKNFVAKLHALAAAIAELPGLRFWSGSLLLVYDAEDPAIFTLKMIDFAQTAMIPDSTLPDAEYLFGVHNLILYLEALLRGDLLPPTTCSLATAPDPANQDAELFRLLGTTKSPDTP